MQSFQPELVNEILNSIKIKEGSYVINLRTAIVLIG